MYHVHCIFHMHMRMHYVDLHLHTLVHTCAHTHTHTHTYTHTYTYPQLFLTNEKRWYHKYIAVNFIRLRLIDIQKFDMHLKEALENSNRCVYVCMSFCVYVCVYSIVWMCICKWYVFVWCLVWCGYGVSVWCLWCAFDGT